MRCADDRHHARRTRPYPTPPASQVGEFPAIAAVSCGWWQRDAGSPRAPCRAGFLQSQSAELASYRREAQRPCGLCSYEHQQAPALPYYFGGWLRSSPHSLSLPAGADTTTQNKTQHTRNGSADFSVSVSGGPPGSRAAVRVSFSSSSASAWPPLALQPSRFVDAVVAIEPCRALEEYSETLGRCACVPLAEPDAATGRCACASGAAPTATAAGGGDAGAAAPVPAACALVLPSDAPGARSAPVGLIVGVTLGAAAAALCSAVALLRSLLARYRLELRTPLVLLEQRQVVLAREVLEMSALSATFGHEIRCPANIVGGCALLLEQHEAGAGDSGDAAPLPEGERRELLQVMRAAVRNMNNLIQDVLAFSSAGAGALRLEPVPVRVATVAEQVVRMAELHQQHRGKAGALELRSEVGAGVPEAAVLDAGRVQQVLLNAFTNACKFTPEGGSITLRVGTARGRPQAAAQHSQPPLLSRRFSSAAMLTSVSRRLSTSTTGRLSSAGGSDDGSGREGPGRSSSTAAGTASAAGAAGSAADGATGASSSCLLQPAGGGASSASPSSGGFLRRISAAFRRRLWHSTGSDSKLAGAPASGSAAGEAEEEYLVFQVQDTGCGLSGEELARLFQPFSMGTEGRKREHGGTGLGLAICRRLADAMVRVRV